MIRVPINPKILTWARERAGMDELMLAGRFTKLADWEAGTAQPTLKQLEDFARAVHVPFGFLLLPAPPVEPLPIPDFRTVASRAIAEPSPNLRDMIYICQERQAWYRDYARVNGTAPVDFIGTATLDEAPEAVAARMRARLSFDLEARRASRTWLDALRLFLAQVDEAGVLAMTSSIVLSNTHRSLNVDEFRGFALADKLAPLVFVNGADSKSAQMFTLAHELAHLWLGESALSDLGPEPVDGARNEEVWCNKVAAAFLLPLDRFSAELRPNEPVNDALARLARVFKVSTLVVLRRMLDARWLTRPAFEEAWASELARLRALDAKAGGGGNFSLSTAARVSRRFGRALVESTLEGQTLYRDAFRLLGMSKPESFRKFGEEVGVVA
jgi:Zn-dependent peptidase ImmA (M78 family)